MAEAVLLLRPRGDGRRRRYPGLGGRSGRARRLVARAPRRERRAARARQADPAGRLASVRHALARGAGIRAARRPPPPGDRGRASTNGRSSTLGDYSARSLCAACAKAIAGSGRASTPAAGAHDRQQATRLRRRRAARARRLGSEAGLCRPRRRGQGRRRAPWHRRDATGARRRRTRTSSSATAATARITSACSPHACSFRSATTASDIEAYSVLCVFGRMALKVFGIHRRPASTRVKPPEGEIVRIWPSHREVGRLAAALGARRVDARPGLPVRAVLPALRLQRGALPRAGQEDQGEAKADRGPGPAPLTSARGRSALRCVAGELARRPASRATGPGPGASAERDPDFFPGLGGAAGADGISGSAARTAACPGTRIVEPRAG